MRAIIWFNENSIFHVQWLWWISKILHKSRTITSLTLNHLPNEMLCCCSSNQLFRVVYIQVQLRLRTLVTECAIIAHCIHNTQYTVYAIIWMFLLYSARIKSTMQKLSISYSFYYFKNIHNSISHIIQTQTRVNRSTHRMN